MARRFYSRDRLGPQGYPFDDDPPPRRRVGRNVFLQEVPSGDFFEGGYALKPTTAMIRASTWKPSVGRWPSEIRRERRAMVMLLCHEVGLTFEVIADVFGITEETARLNVRNTKARLEAELPQDEA